MKWQASLGVAPADGTVRQGDVVFIPKLPSRLSLATGVSVGQSLSGGEAAVLGLAATPSFVMSVSADQAALAADGSAVELKGPSGQEWTGKISGQKSTPDGNVNLVLTSASNAAICSNACDKIPVTGTTLLDTTVVLVPPVRGLVVPTGAIATAGNGDTIVIDLRGKRRRVDVTSSAEGMSVVSGIPQGTDVRIPVSNE